MKCEPTVPCGMCGDPTKMLGTRRCDGCWSLETQLRMFLLKGGNDAKARALLAVECGGHFYDPATARARGE